MNLLAIDTSTEIASVALMAGDEMTCEEQLGQKLQAQLLVPLIHQIMTQSGLGLNQLDGIVFGCGPGSFTGLRIACSIAKGLAYAHDLNLIPISSLGAIAYAVRQQEAYSQSPVLALLDARMQEVYWGYYPPDTLLAVDRVDAVQDIHLPNQQPLICAGVGIEPYWDAIPAALKGQITSTIPCYPNAAVMIRLAVAAAIKPVSAAYAQPLYVRNQVTQGASRG
ncbi:MAG: tRNA (adenosine(37)-N6)-threonylcarbamoyltransferase complex dimerization subunit type 1 TsaB [Legionellales bacterium]